MPAPAPLTASQLSTTGTGSADRSANKRVFPVTIAQDWDAYARFQLRDEALTRTTATLTRVVAKQALAKVASDAVEKEHGSLAGALTSFGLSLAASATEGADRRHWSLQPDHTVMALMDLPAGGMQSPMATARWARLMCSRAPCK